jgi:hypothetical protein
LVGSNPNFRLIVSVFGSKVQNFVEIKFRFKKYISKEINET